MDNGLVSFLGEVLDRGVLLAELYKEEQEQGEQEMVEVATRRPKVFCQLSNDCCIRLNTLICTAELTVIILMGASSIFLTRVIFRKSLKQMLGLELSEVLWPG